MSQNSICMPMEGIEYWIWPERGIRTSKVGYPVKAS